MEAIWFIPLVKYISIFIDATDYIAFYQLDVPLFQLGTIAHNSFEVGIINYENSFKDVWIALMSKDSTLI
jgi:hypothetical protein